jgi:DNA-binding transcriptional MocR family regulator
MTEPVSFQAPARLIDFMRQADQPGLINLAAGVPGLEALPADQLRDAFARAFADDGAASFAYHHPEGDHGLRELLADRLKQRGASVTGRQIVTVSGCSQALQVMLSILLRPGDVAACEAPAYYGLLELLSAAGARVLPIPLHNSDGLNPDETDALLARWKPRCLIVCSALSNPSGATIPEANRERLVESCRKHGVRLIEDDIYGELVDGGAPRPMLAWDPEGTTVSYVSSFSKSVSPGLRVGLCVPGDLHEAYATRKCQQDLHSSVVSEAALREYLAAGALDPHLEWLCARNRHRRELAIETISRTFPADSEVLPPRGGYMLWVKLPPATDLAAVRARAQKEGVVFASGDVFFPAPTGAKYVRLNCAKASEEELVRGLETLGSLFSDQAGNT